MRTYAGIEYSFPSVSSCTFFFSFLGYFIPFVRMCVSVHTATAMYNIQNHTRAVRRRKRIAGVAYTLSVLRVLTAGGLVPIRVSPGKASRLEPGPDNAILTRFSSYQSSRPYACQGQSLRSHSAAAPV